MSDFIDGLVGDTKFLDRAGFDTDHCLESAFGR